MNPFDSAIRGQRAYRRCAASSVGNVTLRPRVTDEESEAYESKSKLGRRHFGDMGLQ